MKGMKMRVMQGLGLLLIGFVTGCTFTIPDPPTASVQYFTWKQVDPWSYDRSPFAASLEAATQDSVGPTRLEVVDAAWQCESHLHAVRTKLRDDRGVQLALGIIGGGTSASTGIISAALPNDQGSAKTALAAAAALGAVVASIGQLIATPDTLIQLYSAALAEYTMARNLAVRALRDKGKIDQTHMAEIVSHLLACGNGGSSGDANKPSSKPETSAAPAAGPAPPAKPSGS